MHTHIYVYTHLFSFAEDQMQALTRTHKIVCCRLIHSPPWLAFLRSASCSGDRSYLLSLSKRLYQDWYQFPRRLRYGLSKAVISKLRCNPEAWHWPKMHKALVSSSVQKGKGQGKVAIVPAPLSTGTSPKVVVPVQLGCEALPLGSW